MAPRYPSCVFSAYNCLLDDPENLLLASIKVIREVLVALSTQLISDKYADKVNKSIAADIPANQRGTSSKTTIYRK